MIIDLILDRYDDIRDGWKKPTDFDTREFYYNCSDYASSFEDDNQLDICRALDMGTEKDVKEALKRYVRKNDYNPRICDFIDSVNWLNNGRGSSIGLKEFPTSLRDKKYKVKDYKNTGASLNDLIYIAIHWIGSADNKKEALEWIREQEPEYLKTCYIYWKKNAEKSSYYD